MYGVETVNWGISGNTSVEWLANKQGEDWTGFDCAIIYLGNNDWRINEADVNDAVAKSKSALLSIISKLRENNHGIRIFICTLLDGWGSNGSAVGLLNNVRTVCTENSDCYLIDIRLNSKIKANTPYWYTHLTAIGYQQMAKEIGSNIGYHIAIKPDDFKWVRYIGTAYATVFD